jgi:hypothetical protein
MFAYIIKGSRTVVLVEFEQDVREFNYLATAIEYAEKSPNCTMYLNGGVNQKYKRGEVIEIIIE